MILSPHPTPSGFPPHIVEQALQAALALPAQVPVMAISGLQGSGKSTLAEQIAALAQARGHAVAVLSIDDVYLSHAQRQALARQVHPLLATRGPPGTHDVRQALEVLDALTTGRPVALPRFDKLADDPSPVERWPRIDAPVDLVLIEGWFLGTLPESPEALAEPVNALERDEDADGHWRRWCNDALAGDYQRLWARMDALWFLQPPGFEIVPEWRWQQEQHLQASQPGRRGMSRTQLERFVQCYERVSRQALRTVPGMATHTLKLDAQRRVIDAG
jgi:D-glycerate 3-kinase